MKNMTHKLERDLLNSMIVFLLKEGKKTSFKEYYKNKENSYLCENTTKKVGPGCSQPGPIKLTSD